MTKGSLSAVELRKKTGLSKSSLSQHMGILVDRGIARLSHERKFAQYKIASSSVADVYKAIAKLCKENIEEMRKLAMML